MNSSSFFTSLRAFLASGRRSKRRSRPSRASRYRSRFTSQLSPRHFVLETLEDRVLLSATPVEVVAPEAALSSSVDLTIEVAPTAVNDSYVTQQDTTLIAGTLLV